MTLIKDHFSFLFFARCIKFSRQFDAKKVSQCDDQSLSGISGAPMPGLDEEIAKLAAAEIDRVLETYW